MTTLVIVLLLLWPLFWLLRVMLVTRSLMGFEFRRPRATMYAPAQIPTHIQEAAKAWRRQLEALDFTLVGGWSMRTAADPALDTDYVALVHPVQPVRAIIRPRDEAALSGECWLSLRTSLMDGTEIVTNTYSPEVFLIDCTGVEVETLSSTLASEVLQRHLARIAAPKAAFWPCPDLGSAAGREEQIQTAVLNDAVTLGQLTRESGSGYRYRLGPAVRQSIRLLRVAAKNKKAQKGVSMPGVSPLTPESLAAFDLYHYRQMVAFSRGRFSLRAKAVISGVSFLIFAGVLAWQYSVTVALWLVIALVIHEGGHLLGMRWFGFRDTQLLFIPFFGGAAVGHDDKVLRPWQHIVIVLLGPLPGIFLSLGMLAYGSGGHAPDWLHEAALTMLVLNAFNLLPVLPLDGGQIVDYAVASRFPRARVLFLGASALGMILIGMLLGGAKLLFGVGVATLIRLPVEWRLAGVRRAVREEYPDGGEEEPIVRRLIEHVREPEWAKVPFAQRLQLVRSLQLAMRMSKPGIGTMCFALAAFTSPLWLGAPIALWAVVREGDAKVAQAEARAEAAGLRRPLPAAKSAGLAPEDNAALDYAQATALAKPAGADSEADSEDEDEPPAKSAEENAKIVTLLRAASRKKAFVPEPATAVSRKAALLEKWSHSQAVSHLIEAAEERLHYHEPVEAIAMSADALRLMRLMQASPGALDWDSYQVHASSCWTTIEEALSTGTALPPALVTELRTLSAERPVIDFAAAAIPRDLLAHTSALDELGEGEEAEAAAGWLKLLQLIYPTWTQYKIEAIDQAVLAQSHLQEIQRGVWPARTTGEKEHASAQVAVAELGDLLARQRQARAALRIIELRRSGTKDVDLAMLGVAPAELRHPFTGEQMRLDRRGALDVLAFNSSAPFPWKRQNAPGAESEVNWRVPVELR